MHITFTGKSLSEAHFFASINPQYGFTNYEKKRIIKRSLVLNGSKGYAMSELINLCSHVGGSSFDLYNKYVSVCM